jgi:hypothetical protein
MIRAADYDSWDAYEDARYDEDADRREDARRDAAEEAFDAVAVQCSNGHRWDPGSHRATRLEPAWCETPECPECGEGVAEDHQ